MPQRAIRTGVCILICVCIGVVSRAVSTRSQTSATRTLEGELKATRTITWSGTVPDADGVPRNIEFKGTVSDGGVVVGSILMEGNELQFTGEIHPDGAVDGVVSLGDGADLGVVTTLAPSNKMVSPAIAPSAEAEFRYDLGGRVGNGVVTAPAETVDVIRAAGEIAATDQ